MPSFISKDGLWYPAKERVALKNRSTKTIKNPSSDEKYKDEEVKPGEDYIYSGPDRAALFELFKSKEETLGIDFHNDPELISRVRQQGYKSVTAYAKTVGYNKEKVEEDFEKKASSITKHELPSKVEAIKILGGGSDFSGQGQDRYGGFGEQK